MTYTITEIKDLITDLDHAHLALTQHLMREETSIEMDFDINTEDADEMETLLASIPKEEDDRETVYELIEGVIEKISDSDYRVLDDDDANEARVENMENLLDDIEGEMVSNRVKQGHMYRSVKVNGNGNLEVEYTLTDYDRGSSLSGYDGVENEEIIQGETYYIYRNN